MLFIMNQGKTCLYQINMFYISNNSIMGFDSRYPENEYCLGTFEKQKRTLEVLNEIKDCIAFPSMQNGINLYPNSIFEMPEE